MLIVHIEQKKYLLTRNIVDLALCQQLDHTVGIYIRVRGSNGFFLALVTNLLVAICGSPKIMPYIFPWELHKMEYGAEFGCLIHSPVALSYNP